MAKARTLVGLDVHAAKIVAAILDSETGELSTRRLPGETASAVALCRELPAPVNATYEAGPTGYGLARELERVGIGCLVAAPGKISCSSQPRCFGHGMRLAGASSDVENRWVREETACPGRTSGRP